MTTFFTCPVSKRFYWVWPVLQAVQFTWTS